MTIEMRWGFFRCHRRVEFMSKVRASTGAHLRSLGDVIEEGSEVEIVKNTADTAVSSSTHDVPLADITVKNLWMVVDPSMN